MQAGVIDCFMPVTAPSLLNIFTVRMIQ